MQRLTGIVVILLSALFMVYASESEVITYSDSWGEPGFSIIDQNRSNLIVNFSINKFELAEIQIDGGHAKAVHLPNVYLPNNEGAPDLPGMGRYIAVPQGANVSVRVLASRLDTLKEIEIAPAPRIPLETDTGPPQYIRDTNIYSRNSFYPEHPVLLSDLTQIRGVDAAILGVTPFQYNPVSKELVVYRDIKIEVSFEGGNGHFGEDRLRSRWWDPILSDVLLNYKSLPQMDYNYTPKSGSRQVQDVEYLIIVPDDPDFLAWADSIKAFRTLQGITTGIVTIPEVGGNSINAIESYVDNAYATWNPAPAAILLIGDYGTSGNTITSPPYSNCVSDNMYADVNGDHLADIIFARITAQNVTHLEEMVRKVLDYERQPPTSPNFYDNPITAMGYQSDRWFQLCSEIVNGFWEYGLNKNPVRENSGYTNGQAPSSWSSNTNTNLIIDHFGPNGLGYIPATPSHLTDWDANAHSINNDINSGAFMIVHRDHGGETGWSSPSYSNSDLSGLHNNDLIFVFSVNCLTGKFNWSGECFAEAFHRYPQRALGIIAATEVSYSFVNDTYLWGMMDNMWPQFMPTYGTNPPSRGILPAFANVAGKYFLQQSNWPYNPSSKEITYYLFHHHGDAFTTVYSEIPQNLAVSHSNVLFAGQTSFTVTADQDALISLTVDGEIIGVEVGTGAPVTITIPSQTPGDDMVVTVTKQNYYRYSHPVQVIAATGPYLYCLNPVVNDVNLNGNGIAECGETTELNLHLTNLGVETATNVLATLSTSSPYISVLDDTTAIGSVDAADTINAGTFTVEIDPATPHLHCCTFTLHLEADSAGIPGGYNWDQTISIDIREGAHIDISQNQFPITFPANTFLNFEYLEPLTIKNTGPDTLYINDIAADIPQFWTNPSSLTIPPGAQQEFDVVFRPDSTMTYNGTLSIENSDPMKFNQTFTATGIGVNAPDISTPDSIRIVVGITDSATAIATIENVGLGDLTFDAQIAGWSSTDLLEGAGGSDTYGHMWIDSDDPSGPIFEWVDIASSENLITLSGNNSISDPIVLGFQFPFYGVNCSFMRVCTNGWLSFTTFSVAYNNVHLPDPMAPRAMIAPLWDDLDFRTDSKAYFKNLGNKAAVLFEDVYRTTGEGPYTFEVILYDNENIKIQYLSLQNLVDDYTVGIQNHAADDGLTIAYNESYLHDNLAILISVHSWVQVSPLSGVIPAQSSTDLTLTFKTQQFPLGDFWAGLQIESNDPDEKVDIIPIHMIVSDITEIGGEAGLQPEKFRLYQNYPNPFNPTTTIEFDVPHTEFVTLKIFNILGEEVSALVSKRLAAGNYKYEWDSSKLASGVYLYRLEAGDYVASKKMVLMK